ncbi:MAG: site-2 protease family protein [Acidobacteria bacterium]|nr:site-2 protease family protein [Acidobacteriota bacterium]
MDRPRRRSGWRLSSFLFVITCVTTLVTGMVREGASRGVAIRDAWQVLANPSLLMLGLPYAACLLAILATHEMGHYIACRHHGIDATPPYFLPSPPLFLFGTFGAFIRIRAPITNRRALFDIGVAGPLAGFAVALPIMIASIRMSEWQPTPPVAAGGVEFGSCLLIDLLARLVLGPPPAPTGWTLAIGTVGMAGWVGLLATALNLLPIGQLDGGHIAYAISSRFHRIFSHLCLASFVLMGLLVNESWLFWGAVLIFLNPRHPLLVDETRALSPGRLAVAALAAAVFILSFIPSPIRPIS